MTINSHLLAADLKNNPRHHSIFFVQDAFNHIQIDVKWQFCNSYIIFRLVSDLPLF
uniref:Uncharacterized protein n=1 Tax=Arundo donax TaxID=35708 RepID=A0A0A9AXN5_ARUDO